MVATARARRRDPVVICHPGAPVTGSAHGLRRPSREWRVIGSPVIGRSGSLMMIPLVGHEPEGSAITVGDGAGSGVSASARADDAAIRADAREAVHLHFALPDTDSHHTVRQ